MDEMEYVAAVDMPYDLSVRARDKETFTYLVLDALRRLDCPIPVADEVRSLRQEIQKRAEAEKAVLRLQADAEKRYSELREEHEACQRVLNAKAAYWEIRAKTAEAETKRIQDFVNGHLA